MKKKIVSLLLVIAIAASMCVPAMAVQDSTIQVTVNDTLVEFPDEKLFVDENGRTLIPVRFVTEAMGADVSWDHDNWTAVIEKDGTKVEVVIGEKNIKVTKNGETETVTMDTVAVIKGSRTFVPIRYVAEALGAFVDYCSLYNVAEIVLPEEVTADEIQRLRSYDMIQWWPTEGEKYEWFVNKEEYKSFSGSYWFSNSHMFLISQPADTKVEVKNCFLRNMAPAGTNAKDYAHFAVDYIESELETKSFPSSTGTMTLTGWWTNGGMKTNFRTDESLSYQMICPPQACISVRGILEVELTDDRARDLFAQKYDIEKPELGKTYYMDAEFIVAIDEYGFLDSIDGYYFDNDGKPIEFWKYCS